VSPTTKFTYLLHAIPTANGQTHHSLAKPIMDSQNLVSLSHTRFQFHNQLHYQKVILTSDIFVN